MREFNPNAQRYRYNGKEFDVENGKTNYGFRLLEDSGIWNGVDLLSDFYPGWSPFNYVLNNPVKYIDPFGLNADDPNYIDPGYSLEDVVVSSTRTKTITLQSLQEISRNEEISKRYDNVSDRYGEFQNSLAFITNTLGVSATTLKNQGHWVGVTKKGKIRLYNFSKFHGSPNVENIKLFKKLGIYGFFLNLTVDGINLIKKTNYTNQFLANTGLSVTSLFAPQIGQGLLIWGGTEIAIDLYNRLWDSSAGEWIINGMEEMSNPQNYSPYPINGF